jgi:hypothetical protein
MLKIINQEKSLKILILLLNFSYANAKIDPKSVPSDNS